jgi:APA family basic amino acid/polyamine antiporter
LELKRQLGLFTAVLIIIADVIGTGIFVTSGGTLEMTGNAMAVLILWAIGGLVMITGSLCYAELASIWPDDGAEYIYLKNIFGPLPSFLTGWISLIVGFSASAAMSAIALLIYLNKFFTSGLVSDPLVQKFIAASLILFFSIMHIVGVKKGSILQNILTILKLLIVFSLICAGFYLVDWSNSERLVTQHAIQGELSFSKYGLILLIIMFSYSGWNGANYIAGEIKEPGKNLPRAIFIATVAITIIYILLNIVFLMATPGKELMGNRALGFITAKNLFANSTLPFDMASFFTLCISLILLSSISVQMMVGPRVTYAMAKNKMIFQTLSRVSDKYKTPDLAIIVQMCLAIFYVFLGSKNLDKFMQYMGFSLSIFPLLSIIGLVYIRYMKPEIRGEFRVPFFPVVPIIYIVLTIFMMIGALVIWTKTSLFATAVVLIGIPIFYFWKWYVKKYYSE